MKVQDFLLEKDCKRYMLVEHEGFPVMPVLKYCYLRLGVRND